MNGSTRPIKEEIARCKGYFHRHEIMRAMASAASAAKQMVEANPVGQAKMELSSMLLEVVQLLNRTDEIKKFKPAGLAYVKGGERRLLLSLVEAIKALKKDAETESLQEARDRKLKMDRLLIRGRMHLAGKKFAEAEEAFEEAATLYKDEDLLFFVIGDYLAEAGLFLKAHKYLQRALIREPGNENVYLRLADVFLGMDQMEKALAILRQCEIKCGREPECFVKEAEVLIKAKRPKDALAAAKKALNLNPTDRKAQRIAGQLQKKLA